MRSNISTAVLHSQQPRYLCRTTLAATLIGMTRARTITKADLEAAERLKRLWLSIDNRPTQQQIADQWPYKDANQSLISQYLNGKIALNYKAVIAFSQILGLDPLSIRSDLPEQRMGTQATNEDDFGDVRAYAAAVGLSDGVEAEDYADTYSLKFRKDSLRRKNLLGANLAVMYGKGDSMEPKIHNGDAILFNRDDTRPRHEELFVIQVPGVGKNDAVTVKQCEIIGNMVTFRALNPKGDHNWRNPRRMDDEKNPIVILGRVRWLAGWQG